MIRAKMETFRSEKGSLRVIDCIVGSTKSLS
jgi:hypothetical protein